MYKKAWCTCKVVVLLNKPITFLTFSLPSLLKLPIKEKMFLIKQIPGGAKINITGCKDYENTFARLESDCTLRFGFSAIRLYSCESIWDIKFHVYAKREMWICTTWPSFSFNCRQLFITSTTEYWSSFTPVLYIRIVLDSFYLLIFCFEKFSTWIWRLPFGVNVNLKLSIFIIFAP